MNKLLKKTLKIILPILLGGFILYWVYRDFDFSKAEEVLLHQTNWWWMLLSLFFGVMSHVLRGWRWKQTLEPLDAHPKTSDCVDAIFVSYATNLVLPRVGEVSRCGVLAKYDNVSFAKSLGTVVTERLVDTLCILLITGITFLVQMPVFFRFSLSCISFPVILALMFITYVLSLVKSVPYTYCKSNHCFFRVNFPPLLYF